MKSVLISTQPYYVFLIIAHLMGWNIPQEKKVEVRKDFPKSPAWNRRVHIYCSQNRKSFNRIPKIYQTLMKDLLGKVIGEFVCDKITKYESEFWDDETYECIQELVEPQDLNVYGEYDYYTVAEGGDDDYKDKPLFKQSCLNWNEFRNYIGQDIHEFYGWHISDLKIYDKPKELGEFGVSCHKDDCEKCGDCPHLQSMQGSYPCEDSGAEWCGVGNIKPITKPFQSWGYMEE